MSNIQGNFPKTRLRRNRMKDFSRRLVAENNLSTNDLILPLFVCEGNNIEDPIHSMPGASRYSIDKLLYKVEEAVKLSIPAIAIFPQIETSLKNKEGSLAFDENNLVCRSIKSIKKEFSGIGIICDVALDPFTDHGHDGLVIDNKIDNDRTLEVLEKQALVQAQAGCDVIAPSDMMDGRIGRIRTVLDNNNFQDTLILSYAAKYASGFYGPFRDGVGSTQKEGIDKSSYQLDSANSDDALRQIEGDLKDGADMIMIKPGLTYLDIISQTKDKYNVPIVAYNVSGEYSMIKNGIKSKIFNENILKEIMISFKRAGASAIVSYFAIEYIEKFLNQK